MHPLWMELLNNANSHYFLSTSVNLCIMHEIKDRQEKELYSEEKHQQKQKICGTTKNAPENENQLRRKLKKRIIVGIEISIQ